MAIPHPPHYIPQDHLGGGDWERRVKIFGRNVGAGFWVKQRAGRRGLGVREAEWERVERA